ncbi:organic cation transporter protein-like [Saccoglossus kowalevskii]|uniref:Organic cation transporter protein-like n=1 Tax=Saccoglossus kowalevskii TaxID=10224 RepID=A0ABM0GIP2_SACKO|nr:PREDICTED: organic cation transporter protein-like [Saccoglossus kowalevskii]
MKFEKLLLILGEFGRYQKRNLALICLAAIPCAFYTLANTFLSASSDHYCQVLYDQTYTDNSMLKNCTIPYEVDDDGHIEWSKCERFNITTYDQDACASNQYDTMECDNGWVYDTGTYESTVVHESKLQCSHFKFDLVCDKDWLKQMSKTIVYLGKLVGALVFGQLADRIGRKPVFVFSIIFGIIVGVLTAFSPTYAAFAVGQFFIGMTTSGMYIVGFVICMELVGKSKRTFAGTMVFTFFAIGYILLALIAFLLDGHWRKLQFTISVLGLPLLSYYWLVPESIRWLIQHGKYDKADHVLRKAAKINKVTLPKNIFEEQKLELDRKANLEELETETPRKYTMLDLMKTPRLAGRTLNICFNMFVVILVYLGISTNTDGLAKNAYIGFLVSGAVELPAYAICYVLLDRIGRRILLCTFMLLGGTALIACGPMVDDDSLQWVVTTLAFFGKFCIAGSYLVIYIWATELFPTPVRNAGLGVASMWGRVGGILSPYVVLLGEYVWLPLPVLIFGGLTIIAGLLAWFLPETLHRELPETLADGEAFSRKPKENGEDSIGITNIGIQVDLDDIYSESTTNQIKESQT